MNSDQYSRLRLILARLCWGSCSGSMHCFLRCWLTCHSMQEGVWSSLTGCSWG